MDFHNTHVVCVPCSIFSTSTTYNSFWWNFITLVRVHGLAIQKNGKKYFYVLISVMSCFCSVYFKLQNSLLVFIKIHWNIIEYLLISRVNGMIEITDRMISMNRLYRHIQSSVFECGNTALSTHCLKNHVFSFVSYWVSETHIILMNK